MYGVYIEKWVDSYIIVLSFTHNMNIKHSSMLILLWLTNKKIRIVNERTEWKQAKFIHGKDFKIIQYQRKFDYVQLFYVSFKLLQYMYQSY